MAIPLEPWKYKKTQEYVKDQDLALRNLFKNEIKPSFLIRIYHKVIDCLGDEFLKYYPPTLTMENALSGNRDVGEYDICKMIIGIDKSNMIFCGESEKSQRYSSETYEKILISSVCNNVKLRNYGSIHFRQKQIIQGDRFLYFPLPYDLFVICIRMNEILSSNYNIPYHHIFSKLSNMSLSALLLLENNFLDNIYSICRGIIELYITFLAVSQNKGAIKKYEFLSMEEVKQSRCGENPTNEFYEMWEKRLKKESDNDPIHPFLHFGWVDELKDYHKFVKKQPYTISGLLRYIKNINQNDDFDIYETFYKRCSSYLHANIRSSIYPILSYFEVCIMLYYTIYFAYQNVCKILKVDTKINDIDIISKTNDDYENLLNQYNKRNAENFKKYYGLK